MEEGAERESERWRGKYYDSLGELDRKEKEWRHIEEMLRQGISRLTLLADTGSGLGADLERVREAIRKGRDSSELETLLQSLSEQISRFDQERRKSRGGPPGIRDALLSLIDNLHLPPPAASQLQALRKRVAAADNDAECRNCAGELAGVITAALDAAAGGVTRAAEEPRSRGLLGKLFAGRGETAEPEEGESSPADSGAGTGLARILLSQLIEDLLIGADRNLFSDRLGNATADEELLRLARNLGAVVAERCGRGAYPAMNANEILIQLLERLTVPDELTPKVEALKSTLTVELDVPGINEAVTSIADLVTEIRARVQGEKEEIELFLKQLTENLRELDLNLQQTATSQRVRVQDGRELDEAVKSQVAGIESSMQQAADLDDLKRLVSARVNTIRQHMEVFRSAEEQRALEAEEQVVQLTERLNDMEQESSTLRKRVQAERQQALIDPLTGVYNRLAYNERIAQEHARWKRYRTPLTFTVWDVDLFKRINDTYGHQAGDKVLRVVAKLLSSQIREADFMARYGGEEFVIILPDTPVEEASRVAEKLRASIEAAEFHHHKQRVQVTISCGIAAFGGDDEPEAVFVRADAALYQAKEAGRNRCVVN